ncbi:hypothetical protein L1987_25432 [Smallanthus sonchifolius]|uniref:Uncharacterized protein n=1 Tax=Smallanthus sonchifolius TaxID=185202 RepID=A0ACB9IPN3_9ASTR|nr:hypothetical protein L1987_25432 [Smallanthus sonchifolius]
MVCSSSSSSVNFLFYSLVIFLTSTTILASYGGRNETDHQALLKIKLMISQDPYGALTSWNNSLHFCDWTGVTCGKRHRRVTSLDLMSQGLEGSLPLHLGNLSFLRWLYLFNNNFQGAIPHELGRLSRLRFHNLELNKFNGTIPHNISSCSNLEVLDLSYNELVGSMPKEMSFLSKLTFVSLGNNNLTGGIPPFFGNITSMKVFDVVENPLGGSIPDTLGRCKSLTEFYYRNIFGSDEGEADEMKFIDTLKNCTRLEVLDISYCNFHGVLPKSIGNIPSSLGGYASLLWLSLEGNFFQASALDYIHNHCIPSIVHGDIKPSNILLDDDMMAHVGDFCLARFLGTSYQNSSTGIRGTIGYAAPEYGLGNEMTTSGDVYSFGILLLEMMTGKSPTDNIFNEGFSLHKFASMIMPDNVTDVSILNIYQEDGIPVQNNEANVKKIEECLASTIKIGVACTVYYPPERMDIKKVMHELQHTLDTLQNI